MLIYYSVRRMDMYYEQTMGGVPETPKEPP